MVNVQLPSARCTCSTYKASVESRARTSTSLRLFVRFVSSSRHFSDEHSHSSLRHAFQYDPSYETIRMPEVPVPVLRRGAFPHPPRCSRQLSFSIRLHVLEPLSKPPCISDTLGTGLTRQPNPRRKVAAQDLPLCDGKSSLLPFQRGFLTSLPRFFPAQSTARVSALALCAGEKKQRVSRGSLPSLSPFRKSTHPFPSARTSPQGPWCTSSKPWNKESQPGLVRLRVHCPSLPTSATSPDDGGERKSRESGTLSSPSLSSL